jgi:anoctamin-10
MYRQYLRDIQAQEEAAHKAASGGIAEGQKISRSMLEQAARESTLHGHGTPEERFWQRQQGQSETIIIGKGYIAKVCIDIRS